jgi:mono/diheme cytochrome c family protein
MESLVKVGYASSPECILCHATGYGASDGYESMEATPELGRVGCEACHGRGQVLLGADRLALGKSRGEAGCVECHTPKRHEQFTFKSDWTKIIHGEKP